MKNPYKIIHKFKNNNNSIQYKIYIFVGSLVSDEIMKALNTFKNKDFYTTITTISKGNFKLLEDTYGDHWYNYFFTVSHILHSIKIINASPTKKKTVISKVGKEWYSTHIDVKPKDIIEKKIPFSFSANYQNYLISRNKIKSLTIKREMNFKTYVEDINVGSNEEPITSDDFVPISSDNETELNQTGGDDEEDELETMDDEDEEQIESIEDLDDEVIEDFNLDELMKLYSTSEVETSKEIKETSKLISAAINDKNWEKKVTKLESEYDDSLDDNNYEAVYEQVYNKYYVTNEFIFPDDTVKVMRNKIATSIPLNPKYGKDMKFLPEYQYFWSEYVMNSKKDKIMIGQKWIRRNELLQIDIEPNENLKVYENLRDNLNYLRDSFGYKIKREDDENLILRDYDDYVTNNEIFMLDVFNELGVNYKPTSEKLKNLYDVYINIYFPLLNYERFEKIVNHLNGVNSKELDFNINSYLSLNNDAKIEKEIYTTVEVARNDITSDNKKYKDLFFPTYILQSIIHVNILDSKNVTGTVSDTKFNLYRIFDNFIVEDKYPFIQLMSSDNQVTYKFFTESEILDNQELLQKWFETSPYGLYFRIKIDGQKFVSINFLENGRIEYKITWTESDMATVKDINNSYTYVRDLINKINSENKKIKIVPPANDRFKYAFINTIQKFNLPEKFVINHNDLSEFCRLFFPYISLVIEPKKRVSKKNFEENKTSKYGTYLRYKRISNYENRTRMHLRILYFLRNYELSDRELVDEVAKQFNITADLAAIELDYVKDKYSKVIKKSKKVLKKLKSLPKSKPPGIGIDIQGRERDRYKIRIAGARNKYQLEEIVNFMKVLIFLYSEAYLYKKSKYQKLKDQLSKLSKVAKRRNKVVEFVDYETPIKTVKAITALDKSRLGYRPEEGQNQWTRNCQNSGNDKKRRPSIVSDEQMDKLLKMGYKFNKENGFYEKVVEVKVRGKTSKVTLKAVKLSGENGKFNYFTCDPDDNKSHMYIGFLSRGSNPSNLCAPCCFKKDPLDTTNKKKKNYFLKCVGNKDADEKVEKIDNSDLGDKIYILQDTNKVQEGRFIYLPKYLDYFFNKLWSHDHIIKNHYLINSKSGYFFKYTVKDEQYHYLAAIANIYGLTIDNLKEKMVEFISKDKDNMYFTYLNNGDIKETFRTRENYIEAIKTSTYLEYDVIGELLSIPGVIDQKGIFVYTLDKRTKIIKKTLEKDTVIYRYYINCLNSENYNMVNEDRNAVVLLKEGKYYFPIYKLKKDGKNDKKIILTKVYGEDDNKYILDELKNYFNKSCVNNIINKIEKSTIFTNKNLIKILKDSKIDIKTQILDNRNKVRFIELSNKQIIPVKPSGSNYNFNKTDLNESIFGKFDDTIKNLNELEKKIELGYKPKYVSYNSKSKNGDVNAISIILENELYVPIKPEKVTGSKLKKLGLTLTKKNLENEIDNLINSKKSLADMVNNEIKELEYNNESYNLFRLEISLFLENNNNIKDRIISIVRNKNLKKDQKRSELRKILLNNVSKKLEGKKSSSKDDIIEIIDKTPNLDIYKVKNIRDYCKVNKTKDKCNINLHCLWANNTCKMQLKYDKAVEFVNKIIEEMILNSIQFKEIIQESNYFVSDIVDYNMYTSRPKQKIVKTSNLNIKKIMGELFGKEKIPIIGRKRISKKDEVNIEEDYPEMIEVGDTMIQPIVGNMDSVIRAFVNSLYWINNRLYDKESRNLGYISELQTQIAYLLKAQIIDYIMKNKENTKLIKELKEFFKNETDFFESTINKFRKTNINTTGEVELTILSYIFDYPILVYNNFNQLISIYNKGKEPVSKESTKKYENEKDTIILKFEYESGNRIPSKINSVYKN